MHSFPEILSRCLRSGCPVCKQGRLFAKLTELRQPFEFFFPLESCPSCHFHFAREPGYYSGVLTPILPILAVGTGLLTAGITYLFFDQEIETVLRVGIAGLFVGLFLFWRTAIAIFVAIDHAIDPPEFTE